MGAGFFAFMQGMDLAFQYRNLRTTERSELVLEMVDTSVVEVGKSVQQVNANVTETNTILSKIGGNLVGIERQLGSIEDAVRHVEKSVTNVEKAVLDNTEYQKQRDKTDRLEQERVNIIKHTLFLMSESLREVQTKKNMILMYLSMEALLKQFAEMNIRTEDIPEIQDKEYYANLEREIRKAYENAEKSLSDKDNEALILWDEIDHIRDELSKEANATDLTKIKKLQETEEQILTQDYSEIRKTLLGNFSGLSRRKIESATAQMDFLKSLPYLFGGVPLLLGFGFASHTGELTKLTTLWLGLLTGAGIIVGVTIASRMRRKMEPEAARRLIEMFHNENKVDVEKAQESFARLEKLNEDLKEKISKIKKHYGRNPFLSDVIGGLEV